MWTPGEATVKVLSKEEIQARLQETAQAIKDTGTVKMSILGFPNSPSREWALSTVDNRLIDLKDRAMFLLTAYQNYDK